MTDGPTPIAPMDAEDTRSLRARVAEIRKERPRTLVQQIRYWGSVAGAIVGLISLSSAVYSGYRSVRTKLDDIPNKQDMQQTIQIHIGGLTESMNRNLEEHRVKLSNHEDRIGKLETRRGR